ncbi:MAG: hypothetical protein M1821_007008 [Bathelium mastoideum]|nr:MAG: hypothetical protein M1821_007008 [Bathelium mastoideum]
MSGNVCGKNGTTIENTATIPGKPNTVYWGNRTLTSPTAYVSIDELGQMFTQWMSHDTFYNVLLSVNPSTLTTLRGTAAASYGFNFADFQTTCVTSNGTTGCYTEVPAAAYEGMPNCYVKEGMPSACSTISQDYAPYVLLPSEAIYYDPAWGDHCTAFFLGTWDPPHALEEQPSAAVPASTTNMVTPMTSAKPMPLPTTTAAPQTVPNDPQTDPNQKSSPTKPVISPDPTRKGGPKTASTDSLSPESAHQHFSSDLPESVDNSRGSKGAVAGSSLHLSDTLTHITSDVASLVGLRYGGISQEDGSTESYPVAKSANIASYIAFGIGLAVPPSKDVVPSGPAQHHSNLGGNTEAGKIVSIVAGNVNGQEHSDDGRVEQEDPDLPNINAEVIDPIAYVGGKAIDPGPSDENVVIGGSTYSKGQQVTIDDTIISIGSNHVVLGGSTFAISDPVTTGSAPTAAFTAAGHVYAATKLEDDSDGATLIKIGSQWFTPESSGIEVTLTDGAIVTLENDGVALGGSVVRFSDGGVQRPDATESHAVFLFGVDPAMALLESDASGGSEAVITQDGTSFTIPQGSSIIREGETLRWDRSGFLVEGSNGVTHTFGWMAGAFIAGASTAGADVTEATFSLGSEIATAILESDGMESSVVIIEEGKVNFTMLPGISTVINGETLRWGYSGIVEVDANGVTSTLEWKPTREATALSATNSIDASAVANSLTSGTPVAGPTTHVPTTTSTSSAMPASQLTWRICGSLLLFVLLPLATD